MEKKTLNSGKLNRKQTKTTSDSGFVIMGIPNSAFLFLGLFDPFDSAKQRRNV